MQEYIDIIYEKSKPEFAFHGAPEEKVKDILKNNRDILGHFYCVTKKSRNLERNLFESKLDSSLGNSILSSNPNYIEDGLNIEVISKPSLLVAINKTVSFHVGSEDRLSNSGGLEIAGFILRDYKLNHCDFYHEVLADEEVNDIVRKFQEYYKKDKDIFFAPYFLYKSKELMLKKIAHRLKQKTSQIS